MRGFNREWWAAAAATAAAGTAFAFLAAPDLSAGFGPIDDHEPLSWLGEDGRLALTEAPRTLLQETEVGRWPDTPRFRPFYYIVRVGQTVVFGDSPQLWYLSVLALITLTCALIGFTFGLLMDRALDLRRRHLRLAMLTITSVAGTLVWTGLGAWVGIAARLGPSESLGLLGVGVAGLGATKLAFGGSRWWWPVLLGGISTAVLSKETFVGLVFLGLMVGAYCYSRDRWPGHLLLALVAFVPALILAPVLLGTKADIYGRPAGGSRLAIAIEGVVHVFFAYWAPAAAVLLLAAIVWAWTIRRGPLAPIVCVFAIVFWIIGMLILDVYVQGGEYVHVRYWAIFDASKSTMVLGGVVLASAAWRRRNRDGRVNQFVILAILVLAALLFIRTLTASSEAWSRLHSEAVENSLSTARFNADISQLIDLAEYSEGVNIVVTNSVEYEPVRAVAQRLAFSDIAPVFLTPDRSTEMDDAFWKTLEEFASKGNPSWDISPESDDPIRLACGYINVDPYPLEKCDPARSVRIEARGM